MPVNPEELRRHLEDYAKITGTKTTRFVCPITLRHCEDSELIDAHILNEAIVKASRRTVIQYGDVDHFYGSRVEPTLVAYLNLKEKSDVDLLRESRELTIRFLDGSEARAFFAGPEAAAKFPMVDLSRDGTVLTSVYVRTEKDDPRLNGTQIDLSRTHRFMPSHWVAAMLKAAHLALFDMLGYRAVYSPWGDHVRRCLARYYADKASKEDAATYFYPFRNAVKFVLKEGGGTACAFDFETLDGRAVLMHNTPSGTMFAVTCVFHLNDITVTVTLPGGTLDGDVAVAVAYYEQLMADELSVRQIVRRARFRDDRWEVISEPLNIGYVDGPPPAPVS